MAHQNFPPLLYKQSSPPKKRKKKKRKKRKKKKEKGETIFTYFPEIIYIFINSKYMLSYDFLRTMAMNIENRLDIHRGLGCNF
jgi:hypothetical protein